MIEKDVFDLTSDDIKDLDVVVNAFGAPLGEEEVHVEVGRILINILKDVDTRAIIVGGLAVYLQMMRILYVLWIHQISRK